MPALPTGDEIKTLPLRAVVAYAHRCAARAARRCLPDSGASGGMPSAFGCGEAVRRALRPAAKVAAGEAVSARELTAAEDVIVATVARLGRGDEDRDADGRQYAGGTHLNPTGRSVAMTANAAYAALAAAAAVADETSGSRSIRGHRAVLSALTAAEAAAGACPPIRIGIRRDFGLLSRLHLGAFPDPGRGVDVSDGGPLGACGDDNRLAAVGALDDGFAAENFDEDDFDPEAAVDESREERPASEPLRPRQAEAATDAASAKPVAPPNAPPSDLFGDPFGDPFGDSFNDPFGDTLPAVMTDPFAAPGGLTHWTPGASGAGGEIAVTGGEIAVTGGEHAVAGGGMARSAATLARREAALAARDASLSAREASLAERASNLAEREADLAERAADLADRDAELNERDAELIDRQAELADREAELADRETELEERETDLADRDAALEERAVALDAATRAVAARTRTAAGELSAARAERQELADAAAALQDVLSRHPLLAGALVGGSSDGPPRRPPQRRIASEAACAAI
ncbi:hypothetical protein [Alienimonas californiensis]|uniref:Chromosome partition protein Smc n=1 Tax=Alienimonas californiensis TaxID=2527989 RepID=A0A517P7S7_9PLAN|nr:hypothetical protein [Alienimonas californiensis]QDT15430.1 hypothetical protein CA12_15150 [Alienimonas californiensis]